MPLEMGTRFGPFLLHETLGEGGFARVFRATHEPSGRAVALKVPKVPALATPEDLARLEREGAVLAGIAARGVVRLVGTGTSEGLPWIALELVPGARPLDVASRGLALRERARLVRDAARALGAVHARGVVHRDVKPGNVLVDASGEVHVTDFGLAWAPAAPALTRTGAALGTPLYAAPEAILDGAKSARAPTADVWALGVLLFEAVARRHPFEGLSFLEIVESARGPLPSTVRPGLAPALDDLCARALARDPGERLGDAAAFAQELDRLLPSLPAEAPRTVPDAAHAPDAADAPAAPAPTPGPGSRIAGCTVLEVLGRGGMGVVLRAHDDRLGRDVAIKVLPVERAASPAAQARFDREAEAASRVRHPNVVAVHAAGIDQGRRFVVTDLVSGETLADRLARTGPLDPGRAAAIGRSLALALDALHRAGIVHRDVKPANVILDERGEPRLIDFGIAALEGAASLTATGQLVGTPAYAPPEQLQGRPVDGRADVYALGAVLWELVAGAGPFAAPTFAAVIARKARTPPPPSRHREDGDRRLDAVCRRCLAPAPGDRFATAQELADALARVVEARPLRVPGRLAGAGAFALVLAGSALALVESRGVHAEPAALALARRARAARSLEGLDAGALGQAVAALGTASFEASHPGEVAWLGLVALARGDVASAERAAAASQAVSPAEHTAAPHVAATHALLGGLASVQGDDPRRAVRELDLAREQGLELREAELWRLRALLRRGPERDRDARDVLADLEAGRARGLELGDEGLELEVSALVALRRRANAVQALERLRKPPASLVWSVALLGVDEALEAGSCRDALAAVASHTRPDGPADPAAERLARRALALASPDLGALSLGGSVDADRIATAAAALEVHLAVAPGLPVRPESRALLRALVTGESAGGVPVRVRVPAAALLEDEPAVARAEALRADLLSCRAQTARVERLARRAASHEPPAGRALLRAMIAHALAREGKADEALALAADALRELDVDSAAGRAPAGEAEVARAELNLARAVALRLSGRPAPALAQLEQLELIERARHPEATTRERVLALVALGRDHEAFTLGLNHFKVVSIEERREPGELDEAVWSAILAAGTTIDVELLFAGIDVERYPLWALRRAHHEAHAGRFHIASTVLVKNRAILAPLGVPAELAERVRHGGEPVLAELRALERKATLEHPPE